MVFNEEGDEVYLEYFEKYFSLEKECDIFLCDLKYINLKNIDSGNEYKYYVENLGYDELVLIYDEIEEIILEILENTIINTNLSLATLMVLINKNCIDIEECINNYRLHKELVDFGLQNIADEFEGCLFVILIVWV